MLKRLTIGTLKLVLYLLFVAVAVYYSPKILSRALNTPYPLATITSGSMWPALKTNDLILMKGANGADVAVGEIIIYKNSQGFTIHRLIRKENPDASVGGAAKLITRGDANNVDDAPITESDVIGKLVTIRGKPFRIPHLGLIARNLGPKLQELQNIEK